MIYSQEKKKKILLILCVSASLWLTLSSCGPGASLLDSLIAYQPRVVAVEPADGLLVSPDASVKVVFSTKIDPSTIGPASFAVIALQGAAADIEDLAEDVSDGAAPVSAGEYAVSDDWREASFEPDAGFEAGATYLIIVTPNVRNVGSLPLNQRPGEEPTPFSSTFRIVGTDGAEVDVYNDGSGVDEEEGGEGIDGAPAVPRPESLVINEFLYDASGSETDGNLFIELVGDAESDISGYKIVFVNGADGAETETISIPGNSIVASDGIFLVADSRTSAPSETNIPGADLLDNFDPHNGPDCVQLLDHHGALLDSVGYGTPVPQTAQNGMVCVEGGSAPDASAGKSISRTDGGDTDDNAADFVILDLPTPGAI